MTFTSKGALFPGEPEAGGLFSKDNKVILSTADTPAGAIEGIGQALPTENIFAGTTQMTSLSSAEKEKARGRDFTALHCIYEDNSWQSGISEGINNKAKQRVKRFTQDERYSGQYVFSSLVQPSGA